MAITDLLSKFFGLGKKEEPNKAVLPWWRVWPVAPPVALPVAPLTGPWAAVPTTIEPAITPQQTPEQRKQEDLQLQFQEDKRRARQSEITKQRFWELKWKALAWVEKAKEIWRGFIDNIMDAAAEQRIVQEQQWFPTAIWKTLKGSLKEFTRLVWQTIFTTEELWVKLVKNIVKDNIWENKFTDFMQKWDEEIDVVQETINEAFAPQFWEWIWTFATNIWTAWYSVNKIKWVLPTMKNPIAAELVAWPIEWVIFAWINELAEVNPSFENFRDAAIVDWIIWIVADSTLWMTRKASFAYWKKVEDWVKDLTPEDIQMMENAILIAREESSALVPEADPQFVYNSIKDLELSNWKTPWGIFWERRLVEKTGPSKKPEVKKPEVKIKKPKAPTIKETIDEPAKARQVKQAAKESKLPEIIFEEPKADITPFQTKWEKIRTAWDDKLRPIQKLDLELGTKNYNAFRVAQSSWGWKALSAINAKHDIIKDVVSRGIDYKDLVTYSVLKRQFDLSKRWITKWINIKAATAKIDAIKKKTWDKFSILKDWSDALTKQFNDALTYASKKWLTSEELLYKLQEENPNYIPYLRQITWITEVKLPSPSGKGSVIKTLKGSEKQIIDPFITFDKVITRMYERADSNAAVRNIWDVKDELINRWWAEEIQWAAQIAKESKEFAGRMKPSWKWVVEVWVDWKAKYLKLAPELAEAIEWMGPKDVNVFLKYTLIPAAQLVRTTATVLNPIFRLITNPLKDAMTARMVAWRFWITITGKKIRNARRIIKKAQKGIKDKETALYDQALREWAFITPSKNEFRMNVEKSIWDTIFDAKNWVTWYIFKNPKQWLKKLFQKYEDIWNRAEEWTRFSAWLAAKAEWKPLDERVLASRDISTDFLRAWNSMAQLNSMYAFLNAAYQGSRNILYSAYKNPLKSTIALSKFIIAPTIATMIWNVRNPEEYEAVPDYVKKNFWVITIPNSDKYLAYPMPWVYNSFGYLTSQVMFELSKTIDDPSNITQAQVIEALSKIDKGDIWLTFLNSLNPVPVSNNVTSTFLPTGLKVPFGDIPANEKWYWAQIKPEQYFGSATSPRLQYFTGASEPKPIFKWMADMLDAAAEKSWINPLKQSPADIQYFVESYAWWLWKVIWQTISLFGKDFKEWNFAKVPVSSVFFKQVPSFKPLSEQEMELVRVSDKRKREQNDAKFLLKQRALKVLWELEDVAKEDWAPAADALFKKIDNAAMKKEIVRLKEKQDKWFGQLDYNIDALWVSNWERTKFYIEIIKWLKGKDEKTKAEIMKFFRGQEKKWLISKNVRWQLEYVIKKEGLWGLLK